MIYAVTVTNHVGESIRCDLADPEKSGFAITRIEGIGPGKAGISVKDTPTMDGGIHTNSRISARNIVLSVTFFESPEPLDHYKKKFGVETTRHRLYKYFPLKKQIHLTFETDERICAISGFVESNEPEIFSEQESAQISIICPDPYFRLVTDDGFISELLSGAGEFTFPFKNNALRQNKIVFGNISDKDVAAIVYEGDVETGVVIRIKAFGSVSSIIFYYCGVSSLENPADYSDLTLDSSKSMQIYSYQIWQQTDAGIQAGDEFEISTMPGNKYFRMFRDGEVYNVLGRFEHPPLWFKLEHGFNYFVTQITGGDANIEASISYPVLYLGV